MKPRLPFEEHTLSRRAPRFTAHIRRSPLVSAGPLARGTSGAPRERWTGAGDTDGCFRGSQKRPHLAAASHARVASAEIAVILHFVYNRKATVLCLSGGILMRTVSVLTDHADDSIAFTVRAAVKLLTAIRIKIDGVAQYANRDGDRVGGCSWQTMLMPSLILLYQSCGGRTSTSRKLAERLKQSRSRANLT